MSALRKPIAPVEPTQRVMTQRDLEVITAEVVRGEALLRQLRTEQYGTTPFMAWFVRHFAHKMVYQDGPRKGQFCAPAPVHYVIGAAVWDACNGLSLKLMQIIEVFRGAAKTTLGIEAGAILGIVEGRRNIGLFAANRDEAKSRIQSIAHELETNSDLLDAHPELTPAKDGKGQWVSYTDYQIVFRNGARIKAYAYGASVRGMLWLNARLDLALFDDIETEEMQESEVLMRKARKWLRRVITFALSAYGALLWLGTPLSPNCLLYWARKEMGIGGPEPQELFDDVPDDQSMAAIPEGARIHWPEAWTPERLAAEYKLAGYHAWMQEVRLKPLPDEDATFRAEYFDTNSYNPQLLSRQGSRSWEHNGQALQVYGWWDAAISLSDKAARSAVVILGRLPDETVEGERRVRMLCLDVAVGRWNDETARTEIRALNAKWRPLEIGAQNTQLESAMGPAMLREFGVPFKAYQQSNAKDAKHARIKSLGIPLSAGLILFNHAQKSQGEDLRTELVTYPFTDTKDILDALEGVYKIALESGGSGDAVLCGRRESADTAALL